MLRQGEGVRPEWRAAVLLLFVLGCQGDGAFPPEEQLSPGRVSSATPSELPAADSLPPGAAVDTVAVSRAHAPQLVGATVRGGAIMRNGEVLAVLDPSGGALRGTRSVTCWYLVYYWLDTGNVFHVELLFCEGSGDDEDGDNFKLSCDGSVLRGNEAGCRVTGPGLQLLHFEWTSDHASSSGFGLSEWRGAATDTTEVRVRVTAGDDLVFSPAAETIAVNARGWSAPPGESIVEEPAALGSVQGNFHVVWPEFSVRPGGGPWRGRWYVQRTKDYTVRLRIHHDLDPHTAVKYGTTDTVSATTLAAGCAAHATLDSVETVPGVNGTCGTSGWQALRDEVVEHENEHKAGYASCVPRMNGRLKVLDDFAGAEADANRAVEAMRALVDRAAAAIKGPGRQDAPFILWYHIGYWWFGERTAMGHNDSGAHCNGG